MDDTYDVAFVILKDDVDPRTGHPVHTRGSRIGAGQLIGMAQEIRISSRQILS
jgi:hypothetical protein